MYCIGSLPTHVELSDTFPTNGEPGDRLRDQQQWVNSGNFGGKCGHTKVGNFFLMVSQP